MIPFNKPYLTGKEIDYIKDSHLRGHLSGDGYYTKCCSEWLKQFTCSKKAFLTHSCTGALEIAAILCDIKEGDEIIMPSYTFVSTANAFRLRGGIPVFVDIRKDTLNIDEKLVEEAITEKTKAIVAVHYAGVPCEMDVLMSLANSYNLILIEDAAQAIDSSYKGKKLGGIGHIGCFSFHETKNIISGEGGAIILNQERFIERAAIIREKGTNRYNFYQGLVDKYTWVDIGSSYLPSEIVSAFLWAQINHIEKITKRRKEIWMNYENRMNSIKSEKLAYSQKIEDFDQYNAHMYYLILDSKVNRNQLISHLKENNICAVFHYIPLHSSPEGLKNSRSVGDLKITDDISERIVRLPFWIGVEQHQSYIVDKIQEFFNIN